MTVSESFSARPQAGESKRVIYAALGANLVIATIKLLAAAVTRSSAMLAESIHSFVDTADEVLLLLGIARSQQPADRAHPFGYGQDLYFWSFVVSVLVFALGGGLSLYDGIERLQHPRELQHLAWSYAALGASFAFEAASWLIGVRQLGRRRHGRSLWKTFRQSKDPSIFTVVLEDSAALLGLTLAGLGVLFSHLFGQPWMDGAASVGIGLLLIAVATLLARESRSLLLGEGVEEEVLERLIMVLKAEPDVREVSSLLTMYLGPQELLINVELSWNESRSVHELATTLQCLEAAIKAAVPQAKHLFLRVVPEKVLHVKA